MSTAYKDSLIEITDQEVVFHRYYFPFGGDKLRFHSRPRRVMRIVARTPAAQYRKVIFGRDIGQAHDAARFA